MTTGNRAMWKSAALYVLPTIAMLLTAPYVIEMNRILVCGILFMLAVGLYFYIVFGVADKNFLDIRAVFHGVWIGTISVASLKLAEYQEVWQVNTWVCMALAYLAFQLGTNLGIMLTARPLVRIRDFITRSRLGKLSFSMTESRLFWICIFATLIGLGCFVINVMIRGYIPCFSDDPTAYLTFYTRLHVFAVAATSVSGLCYYCIKTQKLGLIKKLILLLCIFYSTFLFPILVVSRGTFVVSAVSLTVVVFYLHRKKLWVLVSCLVVIVGVYLLASMLRGYTDAQLKEIFTPATITIQTPQGSKATEPGSKESEPTVPTEPTVTEPSTTKPPVTEPPATIEFTLPPKLAFVYSYLTVSHDNFNEAVENSVAYFYGIRQLAPFNVILRSQKLESAISNGERYLVREHLNTTNLIGDFYYDFHGWGVFFLMLLWAFVFGIMQQAHQQYKGIFSLMVLGNAMVPVALCFFATWLSNFSQWLLWGAILLMAIAATIKVKK